MSDNPLGIRSFAVENEDVAGMFEDTSPDDVVVAEPDEPVLEDTPPPIETGEGEPVEQQVPGEEPLVEGELDTAEVDQLAEEYAGQFADTFRTVGELEDGYREIRSAFTRVAQEASARDQQYEQLQGAYEAQNGQIEQ